MIIKNHLKYLKEYPYWEFFKIRTYYYFHPIKLHKLRKKGKTMKNILDERIKKCQ